MGRARRPCEFAPKPACRSREKTPRKSTNPWRWCIVPTQLHPVLCTNNPCRSTVFSQEIRVTHHSNPLSFSPATNAAAELANPRQIKSGLGRTAHNINQATLRTFDPTLRRTRTSQLSRAHSAQRHGRILVRSTSAGGAGEGGGGGRCSVRCRPAPCATVESPGRFAVCDRLAMEQALLLARTAPRPGLHGACAGRGT